MVSSQSSVSKEQLRKTYRERLENGADASTSSTRQDATEKLSTRLIETLSQFAGTVWAAYQPTGFEIDIRKVFSNSKAITWAFPRVVGKHLQFLKPNTETSFTKNRWGLLEPDPAQSEPVEFSRLRGLLIPALAFDSNCNRLGRGGGFYDRALAELSSTNPRALKIGVALDLQISNKPLPAESFDVPMDWVVTETRSLERKSS